MRIERDGEILVGVKIHVETGLRAIEKREVEAEQRRYGGGCPELQMADREFGEHAPGVVEPDQAEGEHGWKVAGFGRCCNRRDSVRIAGEQGTWERGRQGVFEVRITGKTHHAPSGQFAFEHAAEAFAEDEPGAFALVLDVACVGEIDELQFTGTSGETMHCEHEAAALRPDHSTDAADQVACFIPRVKRQKTSTLFEAKPSGFKQEQGLARLENGGAARSLKKSRDGVANGGKIEIRLGRGPVHNECMWPAFGLVLAGWKCDCDTEFVKFSFSNLSLIVIASFSVVHAQTPPPNPGQANTGQVDIGQVNNGSLTDAVAPKSTGPAVLRAQILLDRAHFSPGEIDGVYGVDLSRSIHAYRAANGMPESDTVDSDMWGKLNQDSAPAIQQYTLQAADVSGPYTPNIPHNMMEMAKLPALNYENAQEGLGEKFHSSPALLQQLNPGVDITKEGTQIMAPNVIVSPATGHVARIEVSKGRGVVQAFGDDGKILATYPATIGSEHDPLPIGEWKITDVKKNPYFHYNASLFWDATNKKDRATLKPGPNSPVGLVWMSLSKPHYGIHGTENPHTIGHTASHGCIRLTNWDAMELASMVAPNTPVTCKED